MTWYPIKGGKPEEEKTVTAGTAAVVVNPSSGKTMKKVTVNPTPSQTKTVTAGTGNVNVSPDSGKLLSKVTVAPTPTQSKSVTPSTSQQTVRPDTGKFLSSVIVRAAEDDVKHGAYVWKKLSAKGGTFIDYVVSDSTDAYPDGGTQGGYWYEKVKNFMFGLTKEAHGSFTPSANIESTYTLEHNLGERPKFIVMYTNDSLKGNQYAVRAMSIVDRESYDSTTTDNSLFVDFIYNGTSYSSFEVYRSTSTQVKKANFDQYKVPIKFDSINYLKAGATYYWQVMA